MLTILRILNWLVVHLFYRLKVIGREHVPRKGGVLLVANHVAFSDPSILLACLRRLVRFLIYRPYYEIPWIKFITRWFKVIPVSNEDGPKELVRSLNVAREAVQNGEMVGIFAEGELTRLGNLLPFNKGLERVMKGQRAPIIPVHLDAIWGSFFSHRHGKPMRKLPHQFPYPVTVTFGEPLPGSVKAHQVRAAIQDLSAEAFRYRTDEKSVLYRAFLRTARRYPFQECVSDSSGRSLNYLMLLASALAAARVLKGRLGAERMVGILLPPSVAAVITNLAVMLAGRVPVNLNYTASSDALASAVRQCGITVTISSAAFIEKMQLKPAGGALYLEDLKPQLGAWRIGWYACLSAVLPARIIEALLAPRQARPDDLATVIFSSGSTGEPKGVMLSHRNICANILGVSDVVKIERSDCVVGVLPFFHSFGFTGTLWLPLLNGIRSTYHANPMDAATIGEMVERRGGTLLMATPSFLMSYLRKCTPTQFKTLRHVMVGAEKLKERLAESFREKFGITPLEGYGCTELSPVATVSVRSFQDERVSQTGNKPGSVGHPIPGVTVRVVDPETHAVLPLGQEGLLLVKGPNVMLGYLNHPEKTAEVMHNGWYITGDVARSDESGFITITDRLSRFSKIGGEMVPHIKIEEEIQAVLGGTEQACAVTAIPHEKKGEQLVVLHTCELDPARIIKALADKGLPNLWIPKKECFIKVAALPLLGSGKLDLREIKRLAALGGQ